MVMLSLLLLDFRQPGSVGVALAVKSQALSAA